MQTGDVAKRPGFGCALDRVRLERPLAPTHSVGSASAGQGR